ncbi:TPA: 50S ribosomal protein L13 [Klebsiella pneumoniae]|nr:50S ribosomal protein L13 [Klebsiella pneumoniae]HBQ1283204.1 50S ribosomal protein L13 [Klebsiella pneumoniae]HBU7099422.1 50S ribosomal protein L13 [Klebsiella pneumoniae]HBU8820296.1 50S ribosomal protein L13 [Klebsiella pneumoniae]HBU9975688.1 50S ribosomal protein L13 [Klebsiella pneumoniae]
MAWVSVQQRLPRTFTRVWVITDTGEQTTAYVKSDGEWYINCDRIRATGAVVLRWRDTDVFGS